MGLIGLTVVLIILATSIAAWVNTKIIMEDLAEVKAALQIKEEKTGIFEDKDRG